jgi:hypothetical protein
LECTQARGPQTSYLSFEFSLFSTLRAYALPSPFDNPLPPTHSTKEAESSQWNSNHGRPSVHSKLDSHYDGPSFMLEAEVDDDFHRAGDMSSSPSTLLEKYTQNPPSAKGNFMSQSG